MNEAKQKEKKRKSEILADLSANDEFDDENGVSHIELPSLGR